MAIVCRACGRRPYGHRGAARTRRGLAEPTRHHGGADCRRQPPTRSREPYAPLGEHLGKPVIVENVAGAGGMTGSNRVAKAPGDGYQFVLAAGTHACNQTLYKKPLYNAATDFAPVGIVANRSSSAGALTSPPTRSPTSSPTRRRTRRGCISARPAPARQRISSACPEQRDGDQFPRPYRSTMQAIEDVIAGRIDFVCDAGSTAVPLVESNVVSHRPSRPAARRCCPPCHRPGTGLPRLPSMAGMHCFSRRRPNQSRARSTRPPARCWSGRRCASNCTGSAC